ncbi:Hypothetical protein PHPALM_3318 [Phytophthora palmivora]|uniref:HAT C-terminal dimerisation domain-containing protein n=1 Tax=Phytophthora palmivora TaxID=4796 RepID=A0A2P4YMQ2_9STRA|nr:Hypothetical protein PHPALM_3318 [Phytophthora palmivora]
MHGIWTSCGKDSIIGASIVFIDSLWRFRFIAVMASVKNDGHTAPLVVNVIAKSFKLKYDVDIKVTIQFTMSDTTPSAKNMADLIDTEQEDCSMHLLNLCVSYGIGLKDNIQTVSVWNDSTESWDKVVTKVTPRGSFDEGGDVIQKLRNLNNYFKTSKERNALRKIQEALLYPKLDPLTDNDVRVAYTCKVIRRSVVVFRRLAETKLKSFKFDAMVMEAPRSNDANESSHRRVVRTRQQFSDAGKTCLRWTLLQLQARFPKLAKESMICILLDPRTKSRAKKIAAVGSIPRKEEKAIYKGGLDYLRYEHRKVFCEMIKQGKVSLDQQSSQSSLLSQESTLSPCSSPPSIGWDDEDELLLGAPIRTTKTRDEVKESEINARADRVTQDWLDLEPEWLEIAQRQIPGKMKEELSKEMTIDKADGMHWALSGLYKHVNVLNWFRDEGESQFPTISLLACIHLGKISSLAFHEGNCNGVPPHPDGQQTRGEATTAQAQQGGSL